MSTITTIEVWAHGEQPRFAAEETENGVVLVIDGLRLGSDDEEFWENLILNAESALEMLREVQA